MDGWADSVLGQDNKTLNLGASRGQLVHKEFPPRRSIKYQFILIFK